MQRIRDGQVHALKKRACSYIDDIAEHLKDILVGSRSAPEKNFDALWRHFYSRYAFLDIREVDWKKQYEIYRPQVKDTTTDDELFDIMCKMLKPLNDGHVELQSKHPKRYFCAENTPRCWKEFPDKQIQGLFKISGKTLKKYGFGDLEDTATWLLKYTRSEEYGYLRILELEGDKKKNLKIALDKISNDFDSLKGFIIDIRNCPGGDDDVLIKIINRFTDKKRVAFHRRTKLGSGENEFSAFKTWHIRPGGTKQFTGPIALLTCDSVFSGGDVFALVARELPYVKIVGEHTNGIFSYKLEKKLPNGWRYTLSYQQYFSADMKCYEGKGVPVDIELLNTKDDIIEGEDRVIVRALREIEIREE